MIDFAAAFDTLALVAILRGIRPAEVAGVADALIAATVAAGMVSLQGYSTPSEAFAALNAGATALKLFPAEAASPAMLKAQRAVLPRHLPLLAVGGVTPKGMAPWRAAGANEFGLGSVLYKAGDDAASDGAAARRFAGAWREGGR